jgi:hypothetical protein
MMLAITAMENYGALPSRKRGLKKSASRSSLEHSRVIAKGVLVMDVRCGQCGQKVKREDSWLKLKLHRRASTAIAILHWNCFPELDRFS